MIMSDIDPFSEAIKASSGLFSYMIVVFDARLGMYVVLTGPEGFILGSITTIYLDPVLVGGTFLQLVYISI
jgi:hypothetical protein